MSSSAFDGFYNGRRVLVTGHTGFKGSWLTLWMRELGAQIDGYALDPPTKPSLFEVADIGKHLVSDTRADLTDFARLRAVFQLRQPEIVFHLAAQPLVRTSYQDPLGTFQSNVMGTANVLEAARFTSSVRSLVVITTDKVYENREWAYPYREVDALGGHDPYSASKAAAEIVAASYRSSFLTRDSAHLINLATARAGNVIGGGDWAKDRLVPDCLRAFERHEGVHLRFPQAIRPWQHVLEPVAGYLRLGERLFSTEGARFAKAWNFGPDPGGDVQVSEIVRILARFWGGDAEAEYTTSSENSHEAGLLQLDSTLARTELQWKPRWGLERALEETVSWHKAWSRGADMAAICLDQICDYQLAERA